MVFLLGGGTMGRADHKRGDGVGRSPLDTKHSSRLFTFTQKANQTTRSGHNSKIVIQLHNGGKLQKSFRRLCWHLFLLFLSTICSNNKFKSSGGLFGSILVQSKPNIAMISAFVTPGDPYSLILIYQNTSKCIRKDMETFLRKHMFCNSGNIILKMESACTGFFKLWN